MSTKPRYQELYEKEIAPALKEKLGADNPHRIPGLEKIVINMGVGEASQNRGLIDGAANDMALITGQQIKNAELHVWNNAITTGPVLVIKFRDLLVQKASSKPVQPDMAAVPTQPSPVLMDMAMQYKVA